MTNYRETMEAVRDFILGRAPKSLRMDTSAMKLKDTCHWVDDAIQPSHPLLPLSPALSLPQHQGLFQWVSSSHQLAKVSEVQLQHQSTKYSGLISFRMDWLVLLTVQGTLKGLFQHHSLKASILQCSALFVVQLSHPYMRAGKITALWGALNIYIYICISHLLLGYISLR